MTINHQNQSRQYPSVIKHGNWKFPLNQYKSRIFEHAVFDYRRDIYIPWISHQTQTSIYPAIHIPWTPLNKLNHCKVPLNPYKIPLNHHKIRWESPWNPHVLGLSCWSPRLPKRNASRAGAMWSPWKSPWVFLGFSGRWLGSGYPPVN